jgi:phosphinothricin acetyltransferase
VAAIYNHYIDVGGATFDTVHWSEAHAAALIHSAPPEAWLVAEADQQIWGWASVRLYSQRRGYRLTAETAIYLEKNALGSGVAGLLQRGIDQHFRKFGLHHAVARIIAENHRSQSFHRRHGYELVGIQREIGHLDDRWIDVAIWQKIYHEGGNRVLTHGG